MRTAILIDLKRASGCALFRLQGNLPYYNKLAPQKG
jgi:hypothetical protein